MNKAGGRYQRVIRSRHSVVSALGFTQILGYGSSFYLLAVLGPPMSAETGWPLDWVVSGFSVGLVSSGVAAPSIGRAVDRFGGRPILAAGSVFLAIGLVGLGSATNLIVYLIAWGLMGLGMGASLYDAAFSALGRWYHDGARSLIATVTLWGGFASTICWPLSAYLVSIAGWRWTCFAYAAMHLLIALPLYAWLMPRGVTAASPSQSSRAHDEKPIAIRPHGILFVLLAASLTLSSAIVAIISIHLLPALQGHGFTAAAAVSLGALIGPSQVAGRLAELAFGRWIHPLWSTLAAAVLMAAGIAVLTFGIAPAAFAIVTYAAGAGVSYIVRGTLPLTMFGPHGYATLMGRLALPSLAIQALGPWFVALLFMRWGHDAVLATLVLLTVSNLCVVLTMMVLRSRFS